MEGGSAADPIERESARRDAQALIFGGGFGIKANPKPVPSATTWQLRFVDWLEDRGLLTAEWATRAAGRRHRLVHCSA